MLRKLTVLAVLVVLSACGGKSVWAPDDAVNKARYVSDEAPYLMLKTMINNATGSGGHAALVINGSQRVMYDPAGRWSHPLGPERNDVVFGMFPGLEQHYDSWHARDTHHVVSQKIYVSPAIAEQAMQLAFAAGPSLDAQCTINTARILKQLPGFEGLPSTYFPAKLMDAFETLPGVETTKHFEEDVGKNG